MSWKEIFKDDNKYNEKSIIGFLAFLIMVIVMLADVITCWIGKDLGINEAIYNSFVMVVLPSGPVSSCVRVTVPLLTEAVILPAKLVLTASLIPSAPAAAVPSDLNQRFELAAPAPLIINIVPSTALIVSSRSVAIEADITISAVPCGKKP